MAASIGRFNGQQAKTECRGCPAGEYQNLRGQVNCDRCPVGFFQNATAKEQCDACPANFYEVRIPVLPTVVLLGWMQSYVSYGRVGSNFADFVAVAY